MPINDTRQIWSNVELNGCITDLQELIIFNDVNYNFLFICKHNTTFDVRFDTILRIVFVDCRTLSWRRLYVTHKTLFISMAFRLYHNIVWYKLMAFQ